MERSSSDAARRKRVVVVTPWVPNRTRPRSLRLLTMLSEVYDLHLVCVAWSTDEAKSATALSFPVTTVRMSRWGGAIGALNALVTGKSLQQGFVSGSKVGRALRGVAETVQPDIFYFNVARSAHLITWIGHLPGDRVIDLDELRSEYYRQMRVASRNPLWRVIARVEAKRLAQAEESIRREFDRVLFSSPCDVATWPEKAVLVRSPTHLSSRSGPGLERDHVNRSIVFVGRLGYRANFEAIAWFVKNVWPQVHAEFPSLRLDIVGEKPGRAVRSLESHNVRVTGRVPEVTPYYETASASIVPVQMATGVQLKLVEAMSVGTLAIVTPVVARGAGVTDGEHVLVAGEDPSEWVRAVRFALSSQVAVSALEARARSWTEREYDDASIKSALLRAIEGVPNE